MSAVGRHDATRLQGRGVLCDPDAIGLAWLIIVPQLLCGGNTPVESQPDWMQRLTLILPSRHFVAFSQAIIYRGAGLETVWPQFLAVAGIGLSLFVFSLRLFRRSIAVSR